MARSKSAGAAKKEMSFVDFKKEVLNDYRIAFTSRQASLLGRREVLTGKAKFGIFGDGKEIAQVAMAKQFRNGDFRSGYYRDQTFMFAIGESDVEKFFAQLYAIPDAELEPASAGRSMNGHYSTRSLNADGSWMDLTRIKNSSADVSPTGSQMPRLLGLALASKLFRNNKELHQFTKFSDKGNEVAFGTIGDASTSEGMFWETINAAGVLQVPMAVSIWDDGYGISVPQKYQTTKENISELLKGFQQDENGEGYLIYRGKGWDYAGLCEMYEEGIAQCRTNHVPVIFHIREMTQPQGHSTSGSHERYKSKERLAWEEEFDCIRKMRQWMIDSAITSADELDTIEADAKKYVNESRRNAWEGFISPIKEEIETVTNYFSATASSSSNKIFIEKISAELNAMSDPMRRDIVASVKKVLRFTRGENSDSISQLQAWLDKYNKHNIKLYDSFLYSETSGSALKVEPVAARYDDHAPVVDGREVLQANFDALFKNNPLLVAFGEDLGKIGDVNQGFAGLQEKYGEIRITDTGIREATIAGQGIGLAMRGLRPIAEIQYLDYFLYALQILSDDLATVQYRTKGGQKAPLIIRTRGHRLEGIWHSGSPMGTIVHALRGVHVLVPRNMTQAAGFYNTILQSDEPALIIECLNGYRLKEKLPSNIGEFRVPLGIPEVINEGNDLTIVTYGSCCRIVMDAVKQLEQTEISCEVIDVQSLLPFDIHHSIVESVKKTNKILVVDEDVPGGASAYILQQILEVQKAFQYLDAEPRTLAAKEHRPAYGSDGDYFSKPSAEDVFDSVYEIMREYNPEKFPGIYK
jgi:pyruvate/2-oxoglutarate/acetoin dehydrogenase E1 component/TPP-dependent pyruvate/acetoin dehydrogenase alpha subunit